MENNFALAIIVAVIIFMIFYVKTECFGMWKKDSFIAQYGVTRG